MNRLNKRTILVGKEPGGQRLIIAVDTIQGRKTASVSQCASVPPSVSRCKSQEGVAHCKIEVTGGDSIKVTNLKEQNVTAVNGVPVMSKVVGRDATLQLGCDKFPVSVSALVDTAIKVVSQIEGLSKPTGGGGGNKPAGGNNKPTYSLNHLEYVWQNYQDELLTIRNHQKNIGLLGRVPILFSMGGGLLAGLTEGDTRTFAMVFTAIAVVLMLVGFILSATDKTNEKINELNDRFQDDYVCPNPECHRFMGNQAYKLIKNTKGCPQCGCKYTS